MISLIGNSTLIAPAPVFLAAIIGGNLYNPLIVGVVSALGSAIGELTGYLTGYAGKIILPQSRILSKINFWMQKYGFLTLFVLSLIPNPFFDLAGISAGLSGYPIKKFLLAAFLGKFIRLTALALFGSSFPIPSF